MFIYGKNDFIANVVDMGIRYIDSIVKSNPRSHCNHLSGLEGNIRNETYLALIEWIKGDF